jgi:hypothetical protein
MGEQHGVAHRQYWKRSIVVILILILRHVSPIARPDCLSARRSCHFFLSVSSSTLMSRISRRFRHQSRRLKSPIAKALDQNLLRGLCVRTKDELHDARIRGGLPWSLVADPSQPLPDPKLSQLMSQATRLNYTMPRLPPP